MTRINLVTATERAIDFLAKPLAGLTEWEEESCATPGSTEMRTAAELGTAALRTLRLIAGALYAAFRSALDGAWVSYIQAPPHDPKWHVRESAKHRRTNYQEKP